MVLRVSAFVAGVTAFYQFPRLPEIHWVGLVAAAACILLYLKRWGLALFAMGMVWAYLFAASVLGDRLKPEWEGADVIVEGAVITLPQRSDRDVRFDFRIESVRFPENGMLPSRIRLSWYSGEPVQAGQRWRLKIRLKRPHGALNPGGFDYEGWLFMNGFGATGYVREAGENRLLGEVAGGLSVGRWRQALSDGITDALGESPMLGVIKALTIGAEDEIGQAQWEVLRRTGTAHLVAISGSHIALVAGLVYWLVFRLWAHAGALFRPPPRIAAWATMVAALCYAALAGFSIPTQRALIMVAIVMGGIWLQRTLLPSRVLSTAMIIVVLYDPAAVLSVGFWLSFVAVGLILYVSAGRFGRESYWLGSCRIHWVTALGLAPLLLLFFQQVSLISPVANFIAVPVISLFVVPACLLGALLLLPWPGAGEIALRAAEMVLKAVWSVLQWFSDLPLAQIDALRPPFWTIFFALLGILMLLAPRGLPGRWLGLVLLLPMSALKAPAPPPGTAWLTLLDVGQGLAAVVQTESHVLVFDTGARHSDRFDMGSAVVAPFLRSFALNKIDALVVSHGDNDHIGGAAALLETFQVENIYTSAPDKMAPRQPILCEEGQEWIWDGVRFTILSPPAGLLLGENDRSCVLKIDSPGGAILLTGDIEKPAEAWLVHRYGHSLASDVIVVPHHGSGTSSTVSFVQAVRPAFALIPAGYRNRFGFPKEEVVHRYRRLGAQVINAADAGAITMEFGAAGEEIRYRLHRLEHGRLWNAVPSGSDP